MQCQLITDGNHHDFYTPTFIRRRLLGRGPFSCSSSGPVFAVLYLALRHRVACSQAWDNPQPARVAGCRLAGLRAAYVSAVCARASRASVLERKSADGNNAGQLLELDAILAVTLGGTALTGGRFSLVGSVIGALIIQTLTYAIYSLGVPPEVNLVVKAVVVFIVMLLQSPEFRAQIGAIARRPGAGAVS